jgi:hypothetical protein
VNKKRIRHRACVEAVDFCKEQLRTEENRTQRPESELVEMKLALMPY